MYEPRVVLSLNKPFPSNSISLMMNESNIQPAKNSFGPHPKQNQHSHRFNHRRNTVASSQAGDESWVRGFIVSKTGSERDSKAQVEQLDTQSCRSEATTTQQSNDRPISPQSIASMDSYSKKRRSPRYKRRGTAPPNQNARNSQPADASIIGQVASGEDLSKFLHCLWKDFISQNSDISMPKIS